MRPRFLLFALAVLALTVSASARNNGAEKKQLARTQFEQAERMREALNGRPALDRKRRDFDQVIESYRRVYYTAPTWARADAAVLAVAELLAEIGRSFDDQRMLRSAIGQYEFLRREYPGSRYRVEALFTIAEIYKQDLEDPVAAKAAFEAFLKEFPGSSLADDARAALADIAKPRDKKAVQEAKAEDRRRYRVTGVRTWSTPDYTRIAVDIEGEVRFEQGRIPKPARIYFDLANTYIASVLRGKTFEVGDGFLRKVRVAQFSPEISRVVLDVEKEADVNAFLLPNPYRLIIDIHGRQPRPERRTLVARTEVQPKPELAAARLDKAPTVVVEADADEESATRPRPVRAAETRATPRNISDSPARPESVFPRIEAVRPPAVKPAVARTEPARDVAPAVSVAISERQGGEVPKPGNLTVERQTVAVPGPAKTAGSQTVAKVTPPKTIVDNVDDAPRPARRGKRTPLPPIGREAQPTSNGERSLIRALGLKIGRIVVDAGHGGHDTGTVGANGLMEKDLVLDVALRLGRLLEQRMGAEVIYTREDDTFIPLETRTAIANQQEADLFVSVHANSSDDSEARGVETYYLNFTSSAEALEVAARENAVSEKSIHELQDLVKKIALKDKIEESREFAADVQRALHSGLSAKSPGIRNRGVKKAPFIVLIGANMPSILAEISFVSNSTDARRLRTPEWRQRIADSLYKGINKYVNGLSGLKVASASSASASQ